MNKDKSFSSKKFENRDAIIYFTQQEGIIHLSS